MQFDVETSVGNKIGRPMGQLKSLKTKIIVNTNAKSKRIFRKI